MHKKNSSKKMRKIFTRQCKNFISRTFSDQCTLAGVINPAMSDAEKLQQLNWHLMISERTAKRWLSGAEPHPSAVMLLFNLYMGFPQTGRWAGWSITDDYLITRTGETITPDMIGKLWLWRNERRTMQGRILELEKENEALKKIFRPDTAEKLHEANRLLSEALTVNVNKRAV